jgi:hypothetical protein
MNARRRQATRRGGARPGSGPKSQYPGKRWEHCVSLMLPTIVALDARRGDLSRNDCIEHLLRTRASAVTRPTTRGGRKMPRSLRLTDEGSRLLRLHAQRARMTPSALVETLILEHGNAHTE